MTPVQLPPTPFDGYEISGVAEYGSGTDTFCEQVGEAEAQFWSLYGHVSGEGLICVGDFRSRTDAQGVYARITGQTYEKGGK